jgi:hypothetical protein
MRIATFNLENFDDAGQEPSLDTRMAIMRPQLQRIAADVLCLQEVHSQDSPQGHTLAALDTLLTGTRYEDYQRLTTTTTGGDLYQERNLVTLSRFPLVEHPRTIIRDSSGPRPAYQVATADPPTRPPTPGGVVATKLFELMLAQGERLGRLQGGDGRGADRLVADQRQLAEELPGTQHGQGRGVSQRDGDRDGHATLGDQVQGLAGIAFVEETS